MFKGYLFFALGFSVAAPAMAAEVSVWGRAWTSACLYYSGSYGEFDINFKNDAIDERSTVTVEAGFGGYKMGGGRLPSTPLDWVKYRDSYEARQVGFHTWRARVSAPLRMRSSADLFNKVQFVFKVHPVNGAPYTDKGGNSPWGFYEATLNTSYPCINSQEDINGLPWSPIPVKAVDRF